MVASDLSSALVNESSRQAIHRYIQQLPPLYWLGVEVRLGGENQVDLHQGIRDSSNELQLLQNFLSSTQMAGHEVLARIVEACTDPEGSYAEVVDYMVLEFDVQASEAMTEPGIFIAFKSSASQQQRYGLTSELLETVNFSQQTQDRVSRCFAACRTEERICHIALMLSRGSDVVRLNVEKLSQKRLSPYLAEIGYRYDTNPVQKSFASAMRYNDEIVLCLDVGAEILPRLGLECFIKHLPSEDARHSHFLNELVHLGLCEANKVDALLGCEGFLLPPNHMQQWPEDLLIESLIKPAGTFSAIERKLNHIKLSCQPDGLIDAKAYIGYKHLWLDKKQQSDSQEGSDNRDSDHVEPPRALTTGIRLALEFLLANRTQGGWWCDFPTASIGVSDEWITAYVGYVLSRLPDDKATSAAADAWRLLSCCEREQDEGWGWGKPFASDADTTSWAIRLGQNVDITESDRLQSAIAFLQLHQHADGGIATYDERYFRAFHSGAAPVNHILEAWCSPHSCVTAAAVPIDVVRNQALQFLRQAQESDGSWRSHWWVDPAFPTALCTQMLSEHGEPGDSDMIRKAASWATSRLFDDEQKQILDQSPFIMASIARVLICADDKQYEKLISRLVESLLQEQNRDGSWPASATLFSIFDHDNLDKIDVDEHRNHTTATVLDLLTDYQMRRDRIS